MTEGNGQAAAERDLAEGRAAVSPLGSLYPTSSWRPVDLDPVKRGEVRISPPKFLARTDGERLIYPGRSHSFFGPSESLKSWAALLACRSVLEEGGTALYIDFEDEAVSFVERARLVGIRDEDLGTRLRYVRPEEPLRKEAPPEWDLDGLEQALRPALVVLDGVSEAYTLHGWDVLSTTDAVKYQHLLLRGFGPGVATLEIDHTAKNLRGSGTQFGAQQKRAGIDGASYEFRPVETGGRGGRSTAEVTVAKDRHGYVRSFAHNGDTVGTFTLSPTADGLEAFVEPPDPRTTLEVVRGRVLEFVAANPGASRTRVREGVPGKRAHVDAALESMEDEGALVAEDGPRNSRLYSVPPFADGGRPL